MITFADAIMAKDSNPRFLSFFGICKNLGMDQDLPGSATMEQQNQVSAPVNEPPKPRKSRFTGTSIFERAKKKQEEYERRERRRNRSRSRSRSRDRGEKENTDENDPNNVHKQCERAAAEARRRAMVLLKDRGLLEGDYNVNMEPITTTVVNPDEVATNPAVDGTTPAATSTSSAVLTASIASTENVDGAKTVETAVTPKMEVTPNVQSAMSKLLAEKEKENQSGVLSWYKPANGASAIKSVLEKGTDESAQQ